MIRREYNHQIGLETGDQSSGGIKRILHLFQHHRAWVVRSHQRRMGDSDRCNCHSDATSPDPGSAMRLS